MSGKRKFSYALKPVLLKRQWDLDALLLDLNQFNGALAKLKEEIMKIEDDARAVSEDWKRASSSGTIDISRFSMVTQYLQELAAQCLAKEKEIAEQERQRDALIDRVVAAQRAVEAVELHRDEMKAEFIKLRLSEDFKSADDHWSTLQARMENYDGRP